MVVQTVLTWFDGSPEGDDQLEFEIDVLLWCHAHLSAACIAYVHEFHRAAQYTPDRPVFRMQAAKDAIDRTRLVFARLESEDVPGVAFPCVATREDFKRQVKGLSRFADLIVQSETSLLIENGTLSSVADMRIA